MTRVATPPVDANVAQFVAQRARELPDAVAVAAPARSGFATWTWRELDERASRVSSGLAGLGLRAGDRACVFVRPGLAWVALVHGLFRLGAVPVLIDPGMGRDAVLRSIERAAPRALIGVWRVHAARLLRPRAFASVEIALSAQRRAPWSGPALQELLDRPCAPFPASARAPRDEAAILFTSGATGPAKGVVYEHGMFLAQVHMLQELYGFELGSADLACFPLFALFGPALGTTSVFPDLDFTRPARCAPERIAAAIERFSVRSSFGSPAIWRRVVPWCEQRGVRFPTLRRLMIAGAPVESDLVRRARAVIAQEGEVFTPYGATEALPVAQIEGLRLAAELGELADGGEGTCVGRAAPGARIRLIRITDEPVERWVDELEVPRGQPGEICVQGEHVTQLYVADAAATKSAKITDRPRAWHRMGDVGRIDAEGLLWFLGRKSHRVETSAGAVFPVPIENLVRARCRVGRCALVGAGPRGRERPVLVVEGESAGVPGGRRARAELAERIERECAHQFPGIQLAAVLFKSTFPVDVRHQAKIDRLALKAWAEKRLA